MASHPHIVVFDIGNVLLDWDPRHLYRKLFDDPARMDHFLTQVWSPEWNRELDRGRPFAEAVEELAAAHPDFAGAIRAYDSRWPETVAGAIAGSVAILRALGDAGVPCYAITNFSQEKFAVARRLWPFLDDFHGVVVSGKERLLKPDPAIYRLFLARYGLSAEDCVFIDDNATNVAGARAIGMHGIVFHDPERLAQDLRALGLPLPGIGGAAAHATTDAKGHSQ